MNETAHTEPVFLIYFIASVNSNPADLAEVFVVQQAWGPTYPAGQVFPRSTSLVLVSVPSPHGLKLGCSLRPHPPRTPPVASGQSQVGESIGL